MFSHKNAQHIESNEPRKSNKTVRRAAIAGAIVGGLALGGLAANAFMTTSSNVSTPGHTGAIVSPTLTGAVVDDLYQGYCNDVTVTIPNTNKVGVTIASIDELGFVTPKGGDQWHPSNGVESLLKQVDVTSANGTQIAAGETKTVTLPNAVCFLSDPNHNDNQFQDKDFVPQYKVNFTQIDGTEAGSVTTH